MSLDQAIADFRRTGLSATTRKARARKALNAKYFAKYTPNTPVRNAPSHVSPAYRGTPE